MRRPREHRYAPVEPFAQAIEEWLRRNDAVLQANPFAGICSELRPNRPRKGRNEKHTGLSEFAKRAEMDPRAIRRYLDREYKWIELDQADRIAMALGIPLWVLAEEFVDRKDRARRQKVAA